MRNFILTCRGRWNVLLVHHFDLSVLHKWPNCAHVDAISLTKLRVLRKCVANVSYLHCGCHIVVHRAQLRDHCAKRKPAVLCLDLPSPLPYRYELTE